MTLFSPFSSRHIMNAGLSLELHKGFGGRSSSECMIQSSHRFGPMHRSQIRLNPVLLADREGKHSEPDRSNAERQRSRIPQATKPNWIKQETKPKKSLKVFHYTIYIVSSVVWIILFFVSYAGVHNSLDLFLPLRDPRVRRNPQSYCRVVRGN